MRAPCASSSVGIAVLVLMAGCGSQGPANGGSGGMTAASGGRTGTGTGGSGSGGMPAGSGGAPMTGMTGGTSGGAGTGGAASTGGTPGSGGAPADAGDTPDGGSTDGGGGSAGGRDGGGGAVSSGGKAGGGAAGIGGRPGAGGAPASGGSGGGAGGAGGSGRGTSCPAGPYPTPMVMSSQAVCASFSFRYTWNEGPTWVAAESAFFFSNFVAGSASGGDIIKYTPGGACEIFIRDVGCNGLAASTDGNLLAACQQPRAVVRFDLKTKQMTVVADRLGTAMLDTPNDLVQHSNGSIYFTNPPNELAGRPQGVGPSVLRIDPMGKLTKISDGNFNGIALSPDERTLYVVRSEIWSLDAEGVPTTKRTMFSNNGDGMAVDCAGNVYVDGKIFQPDGTQIGSWGAGTNLAFGGPDGKTVLVAGSGKTVRELKMNLPGLP